MTGQHYKLGKFHRVADHLYRYSATKKYYAVLRFNGKTKWIALKTTDRELAGRKRQKTDTSYTIPIFPQVKPLLNRYLLLTATLVDPLGNLVHADCVRLPGQNARVTLNHQKSPLVVLLEWSWGNQEPPTTRVFSPMV